MGFKAPGFESDESNCLSHPACTSAVRDHPHLYSSVRLSLGTT